MKFYFSLLTKLLPVFLSAQINLIQYGTNWNYFDSGIVPGSGWPTLNFNDASWASGNAELGYGDGDENTVVSFGNNSSSKHITTYFRKTFTVSNPAAFTVLEGNIIRDDGAVVYVNGIEVFRTNIPSGPVGNSTLASGDIFWPNEDDAHNFQISPAVIVPGNNVIAVEIHQSSPSSSDISFNLKLDGLTSPVAASVIRGPYLQVATPTSMIIRWRTDQPCDGKVNFGASLTTLSQAAYQYSWGTEHEVLITGLSSNQLCYYNIGTSSQVLYADSLMYFKTNPVVGATGHYRFWAIGDAGEVSTAQRLVRDAYYSYNGASHADAWIMLGDNAYEGGFDSEYQNAVFNNMYDDLLMNTPLFPAPGNHDYNNSIPFSPPPAYFDIFTLPTQGEAGGVPSGTEKYYSWDYGNVHFISLDSYDVDRSPNGAMAQWLQLDLATTTADWIIAYWHHPPYTKGTHDSDNPLFYAVELVDMRENILPILENGGVDVVLCGHSHVYERSYLLDGHYGYSNSFNFTMTLDSSSGNYNHDCPYQKNTQITRSHQGTVYAVVGCSGKNGSPASSWPHPAMHTYTYNEYGSMVLDVTGMRLDARFVTSNGLVYDEFTIIKNANQYSTVSICPGDSVTLIPSWQGSYDWFPIPSNTDSLIIQPIVNSFYFVSDSLQCLRDTFQIDILPSPPCPPSLGITEEITTTTVHAYPNPSESGTTFTVDINLSHSSDVILQLFDINGRMVWQQAATYYPQGQTSISIPLNDIPAGVYQFSMITGQEQTIRQLIITPR